MRPRKLGLEQREVELGVAVALPGQERQVLGEVLAQRASRAAHAPRARPVAVALELAQRGRRRRVFEQEVEPRIGVAFVRREEAGLVDRW